jgi:hypothetical protein
MERFAMSSVFTPVCLDLPVREHGFVHRGMISERVVALEPRGG